MKRFSGIAAMLLIMVCAAFGQTVAPAARVSYAPHVYVAGSFNLMPSGYASTSLGAGGGLTWELPRFVLDTYVGYDTGKKENDNTANNYKGHDRFLRGFASYKQGNNYFGVGARWSQLSTTNYTKGGDAFAAGSWHPEVGVGRDWSTKTSALFMRSQVAYMFQPSKEVVHYPAGNNCDGCGNGSHGADITLWFPSPARRGHFFAKMNVVLYRFHDTITDPTNIPLTHTQTGNRHLADSTEFFVGARF